MIIKYKRNYNGNYRTEEGTLLKIIVGDYGGIIFKIKNKEGKEDTISSDIIKETLGKQLNYLLFGKYYNELFEEIYNGITYRIDFINKYISLKNKIITLF